MELHHECTPSALSFLFLKYSYFEKLEKFTYMFIFVYIAFVVRIKENQFILHIIKKLLNKCKWVFIQIKMGKVATHR